MAYVGNDPFQNKSVDTAQLADNAVTGEKIVDDITFDDITTTGNVSGSVSSTGSYGRVEATKVEGTLATAAQTNVTSVGTVTTGVWNSSFGTTSGTQISGSITATSSSIATRFDSRETDMTLATASIVSNESNMTLATASIAAITASISTTKTDISTNSANMTLATASIAAITSSVSTAKTDISTNSANMTLATASIAAITASVSSLKSTSFAGTAGTETVFSGSVVSTGSFGHLQVDGANFTSASLARAIPDGGISHDGSTADGVLTYKDADEATVESGLTFGTAGLVQETNVIRKLIVSSETENTTATIFTINTTNPGAVTRYGAYSCTMHTIIGHCINCNPTATLALTTQFAHVNADSGGASTTAVVELGKTAQCGNDTGMRGIGTVTMGASNSGNYAVNVTLNADLTGTHAAASYTQKTLVELVWTGYVNAPTFS